jgi:nucleotide-binding universal stress UspA family protein
MPQPPQPEVPRIVNAVGHPLVVAVRLGQSEVVSRTAATWAQATGAGLYFAYVDPSRITETEFADGRVRHVGIDPDSADEAWHETEQQLRDWLTGLDLPISWEFRYLAGRADRALTHLARAIDAAAIVVGAARPGSAKAALGRTLAQDLVRHQHRPVLAVPLEIVDWKSQ